MKISRRQFTIGATSTALVPVIPKHVNASAPLILQLFIWVGRFIWGARRAVAIARMFDNSNGKPKSAITDPQLNVADNALAKETPASASVPRQPFLRSGANIMRWAKSTDQSDIRIAVEEIGRVSGLTMVSSADRGWNIGRVAGISEARSREIEQHSAKVIWVSDEKNQASLTIHNPESKQISGFLIVWLRDLDTGDILDEKTKFVTIDANMKIPEIVVGYEEFPVGPKRVEARIYRNGNVIFEQSSPAIVIAQAFEIIINEDYT